MNRRPRLYSGRDGEAHGAADGGGNRDEYSHEYEAV